MPLPSYSHVLTPCTNSGILEPFHSSLIGMPHAPSFPPLPLPPLPSPPLPLSLPLQGLVDSDSLPLNVSREMLQQHSSLKTIKKKLVRKALDMIRRLADEDDVAAKKAEEEGEWMRHHCVCWHGLQDMQHISTKELSPALLKLFSNSCSL